MFLLPVAYSKGLLGHALLAKKKSVFNKKKYETWLAPFIYLFKKFFQAFKIMLTQIDFCL